MLASTCRPYPAARRSQRSRPHRITGSAPAGGLDRIAEAEREGWLGETEGLRVSLAGAESKISQVDSAASPGPVRLGLPAPRPDGIG
ncbi:hypothetical protein C3492_13535 [Streptomyces sp. Ru62]|nr:hypothetical protein C3492_13535 [Streptomyces sp. Ru62]